jgi:hypothetical protein
MKEGRRMMRQIAMLACAGLMFAGCGGSDGGSDDGSGGGDGQEATALRQCLYDFQADVRQGAHQGLSLKGALLMLQESQDANAGLEVAFVPHGVDLSDTAHFVNVEATLSGQDLTLRIPVEGGTIVGTGTMPSGTEDCGMRLEGNLTGPGMDDTGDWVGLIERIAIEIAKAQCFAGCSYLGYSDLSCDRTCGTNRSGLNN